MTDSSQGTYATQEVSTIASKDGVVEDKLPRRRSFSLTDEDGSGRNVISNGSYRSVMSGGRTDGNTSSIPTIPAALIRLDTEDSSSPRRDFNPLKSSSPVMGSVGSTPTRLADKSPRKSLSPQSYTHSSERKKQAAILPNEGPPRTLLNAHRLSLQRRPEGGSLDHDHDHEDDRQERRSDEGGSPRVGDYGWGLEEDNDIRHGRVGETAVVAAANAAAVTAATAATAVTAAAAAAARAAAVEAAAVASSGTVARFEEVLDDDDDADIEGGPRDSFSSKPFSTLVRLACLSCPLSVIYR